MNEEKDGSKKTGDSENEEEDGSKKKKEEGGSRKKEEKDGIKNMEEIENRKMEGRWEAAGRKGETEDKRTEWKNRRTVKSKAKKKERRK